MFYVIRQGMSDGHMNSVDNLQGGDESSSTSRFYLAVSDAYSASKWRRKQFILSTHISKIFSLCDYFPHCLNFLKIFSHLASD